MFHTGLLRIRGRRRRCICCRAATGLIQVIVVRLDFLFRDDSHQIISGFCGAKIDIEKSYVKNMNVFYFNKYMYFLF